MTDPNEALAKRTTEEQDAVAQHWASLLLPFEITTDEEQAQVAGVLQDTKARLKYLEEERKKITVPLNGALRAVNELFRNPRMRFESLEKVLKEKIAKYLEAKDRANQVALQAAAVAPTPVAAQQTIAQVAPVEPPQGVSVRYVWRFDVIDPEVVPRHMCSPDPAKITAYMKFMTDRADEPAIPGVNFRKEAVVTSRAK